MPVKYATLLMLSLMTFILNVYSTTAFAAKSKRDGSVPCGADKICNFRVCQFDPDCPQNIEPPLSPERLFTLDESGLIFDNQLKKTVRDLSEKIEVTHQQPDGVEETRFFHYSTPSNFKNRANRSVNLWVALHGASELDIADKTAQNFHTHYKSISHRSPTVIVYPEALVTDIYNIKTAKGFKSKARWRLIRAPEQAYDIKAFRDLVFIEWLVKNILQYNPQLNPDNVYVSGFSSGAGMSWMLLCYRSELFRGFGFYSNALRAVRRDGGCGNGNTTLNGQLLGFSKLTGKRPDPYGFARLGTSETIRGASKAVFYTHGTKDGNLSRTKGPGCWEAGECSIVDDKAYSMDPGGDNEQRDDISSVLWLQKRHQAQQSPVVKLVSGQNNRDEEPSAQPLRRKRNKSEKKPDERAPSDQANGDNESESIRTLARTYKARQASSTSTSIQSSQTILWYEVIGAAHTMPAITQMGKKAENKYNVTEHTKLFFEAEAGMLK